jgi:group I intron endonuclease
MPYGIVYLVKNVVSSKQYIGQTVKTRETRWNEHVNTANRGAGDLLHDAIREFGGTAFVLSTLAVCETKQDLNTTERRLIRELKTQHPDGYNLKSGGSGGKGDKRSASARAKMTAAQLMRGPHRLESRAKMSAWQSTRPPASEETKRKRSESLLRYFETHSPPPVSDETRALLSAAGKRRGPLSEPGRQIISEKAKRQNASDWMRAAASQHAKTRIDLARDPKTGRIMKKAPPENHAICWPNIAPLTLCLVRAYNQPMTPERLRELIVMTGRDRAWLTQALGYASENSLRQAEAGKQTLPPDKAAWLEGYANLRYALAMREFDWLTKNRIRPENTC